MNNLELRMSEGLTTNGPTHVGPLLREYVNSSSSPESSWLYNFMLAGCRSLPYPTSRPMWLRGYIEILEPVSITVELLPSLSILGESWASK